MTGGSGLSFNTILKPKGKPKYTTAEGKRGLKHDAGEERAMADFERSLEKFMIWEDLKTQAYVRTYLRCEAGARIIHILFVSRNYEGDIFLYQRLRKVFSVFMRKHKKYNSLFGQFLFPFGSYKDPKIVHFGVHIGSIWSPDEAQV